ncbi:unnamed protein product [Bursaphelenchus okinawaensis]|uniref:protein kinase C n=1 Tax=Bursaphelenchus okinawaensis TaxID=465554 RepID=A0A811KCW7_9BILA|nr:unnamed protein product [Bursaphelenchus okinawaensis]CAG9097400.1 unnamed protein product [Bursaphelenchus okinawaensis]
MRNGSRRSVGPRLNINIHAGENVYVIYVSMPIKYDELITQIRRTVGYKDKDEILLKIMDIEGDVITVEDQADLNEVLLFISPYEDVIMYVIQVGCHSDTSSGDSVPVHRRNAQRQNKIYSICGHRFEVNRPAKRTRCEICDDVIWGLGRGGLQCTECNMKVHKKCHKYLCKECDGVNKSVLKTNYGSNMSFGNLTLSSVSEEEELKRNPMDDYDLLKVLGRGSYAKVIQAQHRKTKQIVAMKTINKTMFLEDGEDLDWVQTEKSVFETASNHPFLVGLHSCFQTDSHLVFVIEFVAGGDLMYHMLQQRRLSEGDARFYSAEIILALHFLHSRNIIYRDLKLDNVLLDQYGHVKLTDFGMCKEKVGSNDVTSTFCGTPNYIAPEILKYEPYNFSIDFWALGVLMYEMMSGRSPFQLPGTGDEENDEEIVFQTILKRQIRIPRHLSVGASNVLKGFLNKDPTLRLGCKRDIEEGMNDIKMKSFFRDNIDWNALERRQVQPPYNPNVADDLDLHCFDPEFTEESPRLTPYGSSVIARIDQSEFEGFDYVNPLQLKREDFV